MTTRGKIVLTILILGIVGFGMYRWWDKIAPQMKMFVNNPGHRVPGGESFNEFRTRFFSTMRGLLAKTQFRMGIISHHRNERLLAASEKTGWQGFDKTEFTRHGSPPGVLITFEIPYNVPRQSIQRGG